MGTNLDVTDITVTDISDVTTHVHIHIYIQYGEPCHASSGQVGKSG